MLGLGISVCISFPVSVSVCVSVCVAVSVSVSVAVSISFLLCFLAYFFVAAADLCCLPEYVSDYLQWCSPGVFYDQCWRTLLVVRNGCVMLLFVGGLVWRHILNAERNQKLYYISRHMPQQLSGAVLENAAALVVISFMWSMKYLLPLISLRWSRTGNV